MAFPRNFRRLDSFLNPSGSSCSYEPIDQWESMEEARKGGGVFGGSFWGSFLIQRKPEKLGDDPISPDFIP